MSATVRRRLAQDGSPMNACQRFWAVNGHSEVIHMPDRIAYPVTVA